MRRACSAGRRTIWWYVKRTRDVAVLGEVGVPGGVGGLLGAGLGVELPAVALQHDRRADDPEVDLVAGDAGVELVRRQPVRARTASRIAGSRTLSTGLPSISHSSRAVAERRHAVTAAPGVAVDGAAQGDRRGQPGRHDVADGAPTAAGSTAPRSHSSRSTLRRADVGLEHRRRGRFRSRGRWTITPSSSGLRAALGRSPRPGRRPAAGCPTAGPPTGATPATPARQHGRGDRCSRPRRTRQPGDARVHAARGVRRRGPGTSSALLMPGSLGGAPGDQTVVVRGVGGEVESVHARPGGRAGRRKGTGRGQSRSRDAARPGSAV